MTLARAIGTSTRYASLSVVRDGAGYVLGSATSADFVAVPEIGGKVVLWLQAGASVDECARRAAEVVGEPVDVAGFLDGLAGAGILPASTEPTTAGSADTAPGDGRAGVTASKRRAGRVVFGLVGLSVQVVLALAAAALMIAVPRVRPSYSDAIASPVPLISLLVLTVLGSVLGLAHELAHVLAAWATGVSSRISIGRRMIAMVYQTDLTRLWSVPRRQRIVPLAAGIVFDGASVGMLMVIELTVLPGLPSIAVQLIRAAVFLNVTAIAYQFLIFLRTDVYALFLLATGCKNLWGTKGAIARRAIGRPTGDDLQLLASVGEREIMWAKIFLCLYVPGALFTAWYSAMFAIPAIAKIVTSAWTAVRVDGLLSVGGAAGALAMLVTAASTGFVLWGLGGTMVRLSRRMATRS